MTREEAIEHYLSCDGYVRHSVIWGGTDDQKSCLVLDGRFTLAQLEAVTLILQHEPDLFKLKESDQ